MAFQRPTTSDPISGDQGFYGILKTGSGRPTFLRTISKATFLDPGLTISEAVDCVIYRRSQDADPRILTPELWATYKKGRPSWDEGWSASSGLKRLILDSAGRLAGFVSPEAWDEWVSELERDSRNLLPGYSLTQSTGRYLRLDKYGRTVADVDRRAWRERKEGGRPLEPQCTQW